MTDRKPTPLAELLRDRIVRKKDGPLYFGYGPTMQEELIKQGKLPMPFPLSEDGRAQGWTGGQILDHIARMQVLAAERLEAARAAEKKRQGRG